VIRKGGIEEMVRKKVFAVSLAVVMALSFASCGNKSDGASGNTNKPTVQESGAASQGQTGGQTSESQGQNGEATYDYTPGVLNTVVDKNGDPVVKEFHINGLQIYSNLEGEEEYEKAWVNPVYKTSGIKSDLGEGYTVIQADLGDKVWDTDTDYYNQIQENLRIVIAPHKELDAYLEMSQDEREAYWDDAVWKSGANAYCALSWDGAPRLADFLIYGTDDTSMRFGTKDILFIWKDQIAHYIVVNYWPEEEYEAKGFTNDFGDGAGSDTTSAGGNGSAGSGSEGNGSGGSIDFSKFDDVDLTWPDMISMQMIYPLIRTANMLLLQDTQTAARRIAWRRNTAVSLRQPELPENGAKRGIMICMKATMHIMIITECLCLCKSEKNPPVQSR